MENEPKSKIDFEIVDDTKQKKEQREERGSEEILAVLENAIKSQCEVELTAVGLEGKKPRTKIITPDSIENGILWLTTRNGYKIAIELSRIIGAIKIARNHPDTA